MTSETKRTKERAFDAVDEGPEGVETGRTRGDDVIPAPFEDDDTGLAAEQKERLSRTDRFKLWLTRLADTYRQRRLRSAQGQVPDQKKEKAKQTHTLWLVFAGAVVVIVALVALGEKTRAPKRVTVQTYQSDFRIAPDSVDKQAFQKVYEARVEALEAKVRMLTEGSRKRDDAQKETVRANVASLPDLEAASDAAVVDAAVRGTAPAASADDAAAPRLKVTRVYDAKTAAEKKQEAVVMKPVRRLVADTPIAVNRARNEEKNTYLPAGSFARAVVLSGVTAATGGNAANNPVPLLMAIDDMARLPNRFRANVERCFVTGSATGDLSSERVWIRLDRLSCMRRDGKAIDVRVQGYAAGDDGKTGVRARLVTRSGQAIANALFAGTVQGLGKAVSLSATSSVTYSSGATGTQINDSLRAGFGEGIEDATDRIVDYYLRLADKIFPVLELDSGRRVDIVLSQGVSIDVGEEDAFAVVNEGNSALEFGRRVSYGLPQ